jgi:hypothetical protein
MLFIRRMGDMMLMISCWRLRLHDVKPIIEQFPMTREGIEESLKRLEEWNMRYRGVLVV